MKTLYCQTVLAMIAAAAAHASIVSPQSPATLVQNADLIVVAAPVSITPVGSTITLSLSVARVLKAGASVTAAIQARWVPPSTASALAAPPPAAAFGTGMWFLKQSPSGWLVLPVAQGNASLGTGYYPVPAGPILAAYTYAASAPTADKVAAELGSAIEASAGAYNFQLWELEYGLLDQLNSTYIALMFTRLAGSPVTRQQIVGLSGLIRLGSGPSLIAAVQSEPAFVADPLGNGLLLFSIRNYFRATDSDSVAALGAAATGSTTSSTLLRESAAHALSAIHTSAALPYLATLFGDPDTNLRVEAIGGMASFANGLQSQGPSNTASLGYLQYPATAPYMTADTRAHFALGTQAIESNEDAYLSYWSQWWALQKAGLGFN